MFPAALPSQLAEYVIPRAFTNPSQHSLFSTSTENPFLRVKQITPICAKRSDHKGFEINIGGHLKIFCLNWMMKNNLKNNGFGDRVESEAMYRERILHIANEFRELLSDENIVAFTAQEFAIHPDDIESITEKIKSFNIPGWCNPKMHITPFGVMTCFKNGAVKKAFHHDDDFAESLGSDLAIRCQLFHSSGSYSLANVHVPFRDTETQFTNILYPLVKMKADRLENHLSMIDFLGDKNLKPKTQRKLTREVFDRICEARIQAGQDPISVFSYVVPSRNGHQKIIDQSPEYVSVDSVQRIVIRKSDQYAFYDETPYLIHHPEPKSALTMCSP